MSKRLARLAPYTVLLVAWALRLWRLGAQELWFDEAASYFIAAKPLPLLLRYVANAPFEHPPAYYLALHLAMKVLGESEWALRFPSTVCGALFVVLLYRFGLALSPALGLLAGALAALSPFLVTYSQEARMYALVQLLGLATSLLLWQWLQGRRQLAPLYFLAMLVGLGTHYYFAFLALAHGAWLLLCRGRHAVPAVLALVLAAASALAAAASVSPGLRLALAQMLAERLWGKAPADVVRLVLDWAYGGALLKSRPTWAWALAIAPLVAAFAGALSALLERRMRLLLLLWLCLPLCLAIAVPYGGLALRHISFIAPALLILMASGLLALSRRPWLACAAACALAASYALGLSWHYSLNKGEYGRALAHVAAYKRPGDALLLLNPHQWPLAAYYQRTSLPEIPVGAGQPLDLERLAAYQRLWLLSWEEWALEDAARIRSGLSEVCFQAYELHFSGDVSLTLCYLGPAPGNQLPSIRAGGSLELAQIRWGPATLSPGEGLLLQASFSPAHDAPAMILVLRFVDEAGNVWAQSQHPLQGQAGLLRVALAVPGGTPPGSYIASLGLYDLRAGSMAALFNTNGEPLGAWLSLGTVELRRGQHALPPPALPGGQPLGDLIYLGSEADAFHLVAGQHWRGILQLAISSKPDQHTIQPVLQRGAERIPLAPVALQAGRLPPEAWNPGESWRVLADFPLPENLQDGPYVLWICLTSRAPDERQNCARVDSFSVRSRDRLAPGPQYPANAVFAGAVRLAGYDLTFAGGTLNVVLHWECLAPPPMPLKVFVHLTGADDPQPLSQGDAYPAPFGTNEWQPGKVYTSAHQLPVSAAVLSGKVLRVGLYDEITMQRLPRSDAAGDCAVLELPATLGQPH